MQKNFTNSEKLTMNTINKILEDARRGNDRYKEEIEKYIDGFPVIILRGAGKFGSAFGSFLLKSEIGTDRIHYWDINADSLQSINGIKVERPFSSDFDPEKTLIINCIPNGSLSGNVGWEEYQKKNYKNILSGMALYEALMCPMKESDDFEGKICIKNTFCNWCACERLPALLYKHCQKKNLVKFTNKLVLPVATFVVNQKCSLKCIHCGQYMNQYSPNDRVNFSFERIQTDMNRIFAAVDAISFVSIIGGESFLHPELNDIIDMVLSYQNFGVLGVTTNGICEITDRHLEKLNNDRIRLIFSDYRIALSEQQRTIFAGNLEKVSKSGINYSVGQPLWSTPASLRKLNLSHDIMHSMKASCNSIMTCMTIQNGVFYPCTTTAAIGSHHIANYRDDWILIDETNSDLELRNKIISLIDRPCYESCDHCGEGGILLPFPGEQLSNSKN